MADRPNPLTQQLQDLFAAYHKTDLTQDPAKKALAKLVSDSGLPSYHKEVLMASFFEPNPAQVPSALYVLRKQEELRHADALLKIESAALGERRKREQDPGRLR